eukprot:SAG31_NODE_4874_length_2892_cov_3.716076_4_plen_103_part_00
MNLTVRLAWAIGVVRGLAFVLTLLYGRSVGSMPEHALAQASSGPPSQNVLRLVFGKDVSIQFQSGCVMILSWVQVGRRPHKQLAAWIQVRQPHCSARTRNGR